MHASTRAGTRKQKVPLSDGEKGKGRREKWVSACAEHSEQEDTWLVKPKIQPGKLFQNNSRSRLRTAGAFMCRSDKRTPLLFLKIPVWSVFGSLCSYIEGVRVSHHQLKGSNTPTAPPILKPSSSSSHWRLSATPHSHTSLPVRSTAVHLPLYPFPETMSHWWWRVTVCLRQVQL